MRFYTSLYHAMLTPNVYMDVDGLYRGRDGKTHKAEGFTYYTVFSLWDTFRALHPLFTIFQPRGVPDLVESMLAHHRETKLLPVWTLCANETNCMIGYHAVPVIADALLKGFTGFDPEEAIVKRSPWGGPGTSEHEGADRTLRGTILHIPRS